MISVLNNSERSEREGDALSGFAGGGGDVSPYEAKEHRPSDYVFWGEEIKSKRFRLPPQPLSCSIEQDSGVL